MKLTKIIAAIVLALGLIAATSLWTKAYLDAKKLDNVFTVSGQAKMKVTSDSARWTASFSRTTLADKLKDGYSQMKNDEQIVNQFFASQGLDKSVVEISPVFVNEVYNNDSNAPKQYNLVQNITVSFADVNKAKATAKMGDVIAQKGVIFSSNAVEYYYSKLPEAKIQLLPDAITDAKNRVEVIAKSAGKTVDNIESVTMGVVQVMPVGTVDVSDYGSYDTSSIDKEVMVTIKAIFSLK